MHYEATAIDKRWIARKCSKSLFNKGQDLLSQVLEVCYNLATNLSDQVDMGQIGHFSSGNWRKRYLYFRH